MTMIKSQRALLGASILVLFGWPATAAAQFIEFEQTVWGVAASMVYPGWETPESFNVLYLDADGGAGSEFQVAGSEFQIGVVRGTTFGGDSGWSFVRQAIDPGSFVRDNYVDGRVVNVTADPGTTLDGILYHRYKPFTTIRERVQIGMVISAGAGWYRGTATRTSTDVSGASEESQEPAIFLTRIPREAANSWIPLPMFRFEGAVDGVLGSGFKARFSGGFGFPNGRVFRFGLVYLVGS